MVAALNMPSRHMTVAEFLDWDPGERSGALWQLRDGEPEMMAPASDAHGSIQGRLAYLLSAHLDARGKGCRLVVTPGVIPRVRSAENCLVPDLGITCAPPAGGRTMPEPVVLIEILSPSNEADTRANVWAYTTIPSVAEILLVRATSVEAELLRRRPDGSWPEQPDTIGADGILRLDSIEFAEPLAIRLPDDGAGIGGGPHEPASRKPMIGMSVRRQPNRSRRGTPDGLARLARTRLV